MACAAPSHERLPTGSCSCDLVSDISREWRTDTHSSIPSAWRVIPRNYLLLACHGTNAVTQLTQGGRFVNYWYMGKRDKMLEAKGPVRQAVEAAQEEAKKVANAK